MFIKLIRQVRSPAHLKGEAGDVKEVSAGDGETLISGRYAEISTEKEGKGNGKVTKQKSDPGSD